MQLIYTLERGWPQFAWIARLATDTDQVLVSHGPGVETNESWFCEAVWDGEFEEAGFDLTDIIAGSGARLRDNELVFVSSASTVDRLVNCQTGTTTLVSNSLTLLLLFADDSVPANAVEYPSAIESVILGLDRYQRSLQMHKTLVNLTLFHNLVWREGALTERPKNGQDREFLNFTQYYDFLDTSLEKVLRNSADTKRSIQFSPLCTLSSGYDSTAVACIAAKHGCRQAISFDEARSGEDDTGWLAAQTLGMQLRVFSRDSWKNTPFSEVEFIAADGHGEDRFFSAARQTLSGKVLLTGYHGDKIWEKLVPEEYLSEQIVRGDISGLSLTEFRLNAGFINCPMPFWGARQIRQINRISNLPEMEPWSIGGDYDRPICRRIAEQAGVPRESFGQRKKAVSILVASELEYCSVGSKADYHDWIKINKKEINSQGRKLWLVNPTLDTLLYKIPGYLEIAISLIIKALRHLPVVWRYANNPKLNRFARLRDNQGPSYLRKYLFPWASGLHKQQFLQSVDNE